MSLKQRVQFLARFLSNPKQIGSVTPSSRYLVDAMINSIPWSHVNTLVELGAGTGAVTHRVEQQMNKNCRGFVFERDPQLSQLLQKKYPRLIHCMDANMVQQELMKYGIQQVDCIISSLPFANFSPQERKRFLREIKRVLSPQGIFVAYQYSLQMKAHFQAHFDKIRIKFIPFNLPPSFVYICKHDNK